MSNRTPGKKRHEGKEGTETQDETVERFALNRVVEPRFQQGRFSVRTSESEKRDTQKDPAITERNERRERERVTNKEAPQKRRRRNPRSACGGRIPAAGGPDNSMHITGCGRGIHHVRAGAGGVCSRCRQATGDSGSVHRSQPHRCLCLCAVLLDMQSRSLLSISPDPAYRWTCLFLAPAILTGSYRHRGTRSPSGQRIKT